MGSILSNVIKNLKQVGQETVEIAAKNTGEMTSSVITGEALIGGIKPMSDSEMQKAKQEEAKKQQEAEKIKQEYIGRGRDVDAEIGEVVQEKKKQEEEQEKFLLNLEKQRLAEVREREQMNLNVPGNSKKEAAKHQGQRGHKKQAPDPVVMSATGEKTGGKID